MPEGNLSPCSRLGHSDVGGAHPIFYSRHAELCLQASCHKSVRAPHYKWMVQPRDVGWGTAHAPAAGSATGWGTRSLQDAPCDTRGGCDPAEPASAGRFLSRPAPCFVSDTCPCPTRPMLRPSGSCLLQPSGSCVSGSASSHAHPPSRPAGCGAGAGPRTCDGGAGTVPEPDPSLGPGEELGMGGGFEISRVFCWILGIPCESGPKPQAGGGA